MKKNVLLASFALTIALAACEKKADVPHEATGDTAVVKQDNGMNNGAGTNNGTGAMGADTLNNDWSTYDWNLVDRNVPDVTYPEITGKGVTLRGNDKYTVYSLGDNVLFATGKAEINKAAENDLKQIAASISQRYGQGAVRIYGFTDATGGTDNQQLSQQRADAVKNWLIQNGQIAENRISIHPMGTSNPVATNETAKGRQQNRRVEIVAVNR